MNSAVGRWFKAGALMFIVTLIVAGCEGPAGKPGEPGKPGDPAEAAGIPPQVTQQISPITLVAGKSASPIALSDHFFDPDAGEGDSLTFTVSSDQEAVASGSVADGMLTVRASSMAGVAKLTITATDPQDLSNRMLVTVTVMEAAAPNQAPTAVGFISEVKVTVGESKTEDVASAFSDSDEGDTLTYEASVPDGENDASVTVEGSVVTITGKMVGSATVTVTATDAGGLSDMQTINVDVIAVDSGEAPRAVGTPTKISLGAKASQTVGVAGYFNHADKAPLTYTAESNSAAVTAKITGSSLMVTANNETTSSIMARVTVTATDSDGQTAQQQFEVMVEAMAPPVTTNYEVKIGAKPLVVDALDHFTAMEGAIYTANPYTGVVNVAIKTGSKTEFEFVAIQKGTAPVLLEQTSKDKLTVNEFEITVTVPNQIPEIVTGKVYPSDEWTGSIVAAGTFKDDGVFVFDVDSLRDYFTDPDFDVFGYESDYSTPQAKVLGVEDTAIYVDVYNAKSERVVSVPIYAEDDGDPDVDNDDARSLRSVRVRLLIDTVAPQMVAVPERADGQLRDTRDVQLRLGSGAEESMLTFGEAAANEGGIGLIRKKRANIGSTRVLIHKTDELDATIAAAIDVAASGSSIKLLKCNPKDSEPKLSLVLADGKPEKEDADNDMYKLCFEPTTLGTTTITFSYTVSAANANAKPPLTAITASDTFKVTVIRAKPKTW